MADGLQGFDRLREQRRLEDEALGEASKYFFESPAAMQRTNIAAARALLSSGNSRKTNRTLPVSIYFIRKSGSTFSSKSAQYGQVRER